MTEPLSGETSSNLISTGPANAARRGFPTLHFFLLLVVAACMFFVGIGRMSLIEPDEGRNAEVAR